MLDLSNHLDLVNLYFAIYNNFNRPELVRIVKQMGFDVDNFRLWDSNFQDDVREIILFANRRSHLSELITICQELKPGFNLSEATPDFPEPEQTETITEIQLPALLSTHFSVGDLHQLCFLLNVNLDNVGGGMLLGENQRALSEDEKEYLLDRQGINSDDTPLSEIKRILKEDKIWHLLTYWQRHGHKLARIIAISAYLKPAIFEEVA